MSLPTPEPGLVIRYAYLWRYEAMRGQEEGRKDRPAVIVITLENSSSGKRVAVVPITHLHPDNSNDSIPIPPKVKQRLGLDGDDSWIITNEMNVFEWPGPDIRPVSRDKPSDYAFGSIPEALLNQILDRIRQRLRRKNIVRRTE